MASTVSFTVDSPQGLRTVEVSYERTGAGAPLVLLHGIGHHRQAWDPVLRILAAERDVIAVDLPGFGASPALPHGLAHDRRTMVPVLGSFFEALGVVRPHVAGNSLGGLLALELGREGLARSVTALSPAGFWTPSERRYAFGVLRAMRGAALAMPMPLIERLSRSSPGRAALTSTIYARPGRRSPAAVVSETVALREATGFRQTLEAGSGVTFADDVPGVPVSIAWGSKDRLLPRCQGVRAGRAIPRARLVRLPGCGHVPMNDDPAAVARVVLDTSR
ncbi:alpha/beta fold hydrolase [[Kitasatospora] papulosa]|uniref:Alpha/beta fold hydrolase n=1 Tax=[Kitasatospora] papulosa TaxID=1464011 RepID=A0ABZ1K0V7_9ACTN|nr:MULTISPECIES: alpha/beta fold hydrolase [Streptomyces]TPN29323.1 alpha/beta fold hydrolase [Mesorhizobium sp. B2-3-3]MCY1650297.1 alpha/beta fold hydrolase [Streptomyces sp. SL203]MCY1682577.1 alpha/beta fold hydrolase [Streptomyces sp. SL294]MDX3185617.1 alpha/beta fold hydrolase [Streptomyces sp. ME02-7008A-1]MDX3306694.1 alpha/beta fold hydrolase [Streptomyces sp. ME02-7008A]